MNGYCATGTDTREFTKVAESEFIFSHLFLVIKTELNCELLNKYECVYYFDTCYLRNTHSGYLFINKKKSFAKLVDLHLASSGSYMPEYLCDYFYLL